MQNHRILFARAPRGQPVLDDFGADTVPVPVPGEGQFLSRTQYLSLDPYYRSVMKGSPMYTERLVPGAVMSGETVAQVVDMLCGHGVSRKAATGRDVRRIGGDRSGWQHGRTGRAAHGCPRRWDR